MEILGILKNPSLKVMDSLLTLGVLAFVGATVLEKSTETKAGLNHCHGIRYREEDELVSPVGPTIGF